MDTKLRSIPLFLLILSTLLLPASAGAEQDGPGVESLELIHVNGSTGARLRLFNPGNDATDLRLQLQLLDTNNGVAAVKDAYLHLPPGRHHRTVPLPAVDALADIQRRRLSWYRLRYRLFDAFTGRFLFTGVEGIAGIADDALSLVLTGPESVSPEHPLHVMVRAQHPLTGAPAAGIDVELVIADDMGEADPVILTLPTDEDGEAWASPLVPSLGDLSDLELTVRASRGPFIEELSADIWVTDAFPITLVTDRPIYQPGQAVHYRVLAIEPGRPALAGRELELIIEDEEGTACHRVTGQTTEYGLFHGTWQTSEQTPVGEYQIELVAMDEDGEETGYGDRSFRISRYELPTLAVRTETDRPWYLPGELPEVTISAMTLSGEAISGAAVEILSLHARSWFFDPADSGEDESVVLLEGITDGEGKWSGTIEGDVFIERAGSFWKFGYGEFRDIAFAARITDPDSGRTALGRFDVRLTREKVHVYLEKWEDGAPGMPMLLRVSTFSPAGDPLLCSFRIFRTGTEGQGEPLVFSSTDRWGLAEIELDPPPGHGRRFDLSVQAVAGDGSTGSAEELIRHYEEPLIRLRPERFRFVSGGTIPVTVSCWPPEAAVWIEADIDGEVLWGRHLEVAGGRQKIVVPWDPRFKGEVNVRAFFERIGLDDEALPGSRATVLFPDPAGNLNFSLDLEPGDGRPGDSVTAQLTLAGADGAPVRGVAGLVAVDTALEEMLAERGHHRARSYFMHTSEAFFQGWGEGHAGLHRRDLSGLPGGEDELGPLARRLLMWGPDERMAVSSDHAYHSSRLYRGLATACLTEAAAVLNRKIRYGISKGPVDNDELERLLAANGLSLASMLDPWDRPFIATFRLDRAHRVLTLTSCGSDGTAGTEDDIRAWSRRWRWFLCEGRDIELAVKQHHRDHGRWPLDAGNLIEALRSQEIHWEVARDPWGHPLTVEVLPVGSTLNIIVRSPGPDGLLEQDRWAGDDVVAWSGAVDTFAALASRMQDALTVHFATGRGAPADEGELLRMLAAAGIGDDELVDLHGIPFDLDPGLVPVFHTVMRIVDGHTEPVPVKALEASILVRSIGADRRSGTADDWEVARLLIPIDPDAGGNQAAPGEHFDLDEHTGCISGRVTDHQGIPLPGATVTIIPKLGDGQRMAVTDGDGRFALILPAGSYSLFFRLDGFGTCIISAVAVEPWRVSRVFPSLGVTGSLGEITVTAKAPVINVTNTAIVASISELDYEQANFGEIAVVDVAAEEQHPKVPKTRQRPFSTPRLRKDFPETLFWEPELHFGDDDGSASITFDLADAVTTWNVQAVASTDDGRLVAATVPLVASLPFYIDLEHPQVLTVGDRIDLPVVLRNFSGVEQSVSVELSAGPALQVDGGRGTVYVAAGEAEPARFTVRAVGPAADVAIRATAIGDDAADAVERHLAVEPDGERLVVTRSAALTSETAIECVLPQHVVPGTVDARLVVLPDFAAQLAATFEGVLRRPTGCAEQITSAAWLRVLRLEFFAAVGITEGPEVERDRFTLVEVLGRLVELQHSDGGFSFWRGGKSRAGLTAHILRFALAAGRWVEVDSGMTRRAAEWLSGQQTAVGTWRSTWARLHDPDDVQLSAAVTRALAEVLRDSRIPAAEDAVARGLAWLEPRLQRFPEPHALAAFALACRETGRDDACRQARQLLAEQARVEGPSVYWHLEANTPLGGWGLPGRLETTALAVQALAGGGEAFRQQVAGGNRFLMRNKDRYGVWHSTLGTVSVLEALAASGLGGGTRGGLLRVVVGDEQRAEVALPNGRAALTPIYLELGSGFDIGSTPIRLERSGGDSEVIADLEVSYCRPWPAEKDRCDTVRQGNLSLSVSFDRHDVVVGETVRCNVHAERVAHRGFGMLLAEVGLPPGAVVDRLALERELGSRFEIRPDRVVLYLWPRAGGSDVEVLFKLRFSGEMVTAPSQLYDYYNPEAGVTLPPQRFNGRGSVPLP